MKRLILAALLAAATLASASLAETKPAIAAAKGETITASVNGLVCDFCAASLKKVFGKEAAVSTVSVDLDHGKVQIQLKPGTSLADDKVKELIRKSGFALTGIERAAG